jgi:guanylate kinase
MRVSTDGGAPAPPAEADPYRRLESPLVVVISGPSGVGKDATLKKMQELGYPFHFVVTATIKRLMPEAIFIFLTAESEDALIKRLMERKTETPEGLKIRAATAREELKRIGDFDYCVINRECNLLETAETIHAIIRAEKCRVRPRVVRL